MSLLDPSFFLSLVLFLLVGINLGLLGGGGSILAVPVLVYVTKLPASTAIPLSLLIVGSSSFFASLSHYRHGDVRLKAAMFVGMGGILGASQGARLTHFFEDRFLLLLFASLMTTVGLIMLLRRQREERKTKEQEAGVLLSILTGAAVGLLTGFLGVGGGFLLVPALLYVTGLPIQTAIGTSLLLIALNSAVGFMVHLKWIEIPWDIALSSVALATLGGFLGSRLSRTLDRKVLRRLFGVFITTLGAILFFLNL